MKRVFRASSPQSVAGLALVLGSLLSVYGSKSASADGYFVYDNAIVTNRFVISDPNSSAYFNAGQTTSASSYSNYAAKEGASKSTASAQGGANVYFAWFNADSRSPKPTTRYNATTNGSASGSASTSGASASSSATGYGAKSTQPAYNEGSAFVRDLGVPSSSPNISVSVSASTSAGPDNTADPAQEKYGSPTAASAVGSSNVTIDHSSLG